MNPELLPAIVLLAVAGATLWKIKFRSLATLCFIITALCLLVGLGVIA